jgi:hypothetical protein
MSYSVMAVLVPAIHAFTLVAHCKTWMSGSADRSRQSAQAWLAPGTTNSLNDR